MKRFKEVSLEARSFSKLVGNASLQTVGLIQFLGTFSFNFLLFIIIFWLSKTLASSSYGVFS